MSIVSWILTSFIIYEGSISELHSLIIPSILFVLNFYVFGKALDKSRFNIFSYFAIFLVLIFFMTITTLNFQYISLISTFLFANVLLAFLFREKQIQNTSIKESKKSENWKHPFINQNFKLRENNNSKLSFTFLKLLMKQVQKYI